MTEEWLPSLIKSSVALGVLPDVMGKASWLPVVDAAGAILDIAELSVSGDRDGCQYFNVAHSNPVPWTELMKAFPLASGKYL